MCVESDSTVLFVIRVLGGVRTVLVVVLVVAVLVVVVVLVVAL